MTKFKAHVHSFGFNLVHIVFVTKYRHPVITDKIENRLCQLITKLCQTQDCELLQCQADLGTKDHIHLLVDIAPKISLSKLANILKTITSREIRKEFATQLKPDYWKPVFWKRGFGYTSAGEVASAEVSSAACDGRGAPLTVLKQYIEREGCSRSCDPAPPAGARERARPEGSESISNHAVENQGDDS